MKMVICVYLLRNCVKISELIEEQGDLSVKTWNYEEYYYKDADYPEYSNDDEECVVIG